MLENPSPRDRFPIKAAVATGLVAFALYFCMYAFRKPFTAARYDGLMLWGMDFKVVLVIMQVVGYAISKFVGIRIISSLTDRYRWQWILGCMALAGASLFGFAVLPYPYNAACMLLNGLPLGLIWGLVFSYLEGRQTTEVMAAILSSSFILASGMVKTVGQWLMLEFGVTEFWMPAVTCSLFVLPLMLFTFLLQKTPAPSVRDLELRRKRAPMTGKQRNKLFLSMAPGLILLVLLYMAITAFRDFRDNFNLEIWEDLGVTNNPAIFTRTEAIVSLAVLIVFALLFLIRDNYRAFRWLNFMIITGISLIGLTNILFLTTDSISPFWWTVLVGTGLYLAYFPYNSILFERLIASCKETGNAGFLIYIADAFGYLGSILILLYKSFYGAEISHLDFVINIGIVLCVAGIGLIVLSLRYFQRKLKRALPV